MSKPPTMPARTKLNVLVYTGEGTTRDSVRHCIYSLGRLLSPNYAVRPVTETVLLREPWAGTCALLVVPGGADLGYCRVLNGSGNRLISEYVRRGGAYLGFCAGGYYGSGRCEFEVGHGKLEVAGPRELALFPGTCRGAAFAGFRYQSEAGARAARLLVRKASFAGVGVLPEEFRCYYNGGGVFVDADSDAMADRGVEVLAEYVEPLTVKGTGTAAVVYCKVGRGGAVLTGPHPEFAAANLHAQPDVPGYEDVVRAIREDDEARISFFRGCLAKLGLEVNDDMAVPPGLSDLHLSALGSRVAELSTLVHSLGGENDVFHLVAGDEGTLKCILRHDQAWPSPEETPYFSHELYFSSLEAYREKEGQGPGQAYHWGDVLMYGQVVTSTNTLLDRNPRLLSHLPTGTTLAATTQVAGRGRGSNVWVSPTGSLIMSTVIKHAAHLSSSRPVVFVQYLAAVAVAEAILTYGDHEAYGSLPVKLKWPNDIYARDPTSTPEAPRYVKMGGILANCSYSAAAGHYHVVLGIGINATNGRPTTSLDALLQHAWTKEAQSGPAPFRVERLLARILTRLESLYKHFCRDGFTAELEARYYSHWLHTGQVVTLEAEGGARARVLGITRDWGLLRAEEVGHDGRATGRVWALQSDENSFDFWQGLVRRRL